MIWAQFPGATSTSAAGINNRGEIVGSYTDSSGTHGFIFANGVFTRFDVSFPSINVTRTAAAGINDLGEIVPYRLGSTTMRRLRRLLPRVLASRTRRGLSLPNPSKRFYWDRDYSRKLNPSEITGSTCKKEAS